ncbi:MAG: PaaI family thioesterase [Methanotrichaceae archaeon]
MDDVLKSLAENFEKEPYARLLGIQLEELEQGRALVKMNLSEDFNNIFGATHGGTIFSLMDAAFELTVNSHGTVAVALNVSVNYINPVSAGETIYAEGMEVSRSNRISTCKIDVKGGDGRVIATCQAMAYRKKDKLPFL